MDTDRRQARLVEAFAARIRTGEKPLLIETHVSRIVLSGDYAYKFKRPLNFGFLDYSSLERRRLFCREELRLNRRTAPELYLDVIGIGDDGLPGSDAEEVAEFAVRMKRFSEQAVFSRLLACGRLQASHVDALARQIARFHRSIPASRRYGTPEMVFAPMKQNFDQLRTFLVPPPDELAGVERWTEQCFQALVPVLEQRRTAGFVRECHGDLHLNNIVLLDGRPTPFDAIEFNAELRFIDTASEIAFLTMDLTDRGRSDLAHRFLSGYLEWSGDFGALEPLRFYQVYRAMVRAKVAAIRLSQSAENEEARGAVASYLALAAQYTRPAQPFLAVTCGFSGSGKSTAAAELVARFGAVRIRSDVERKRLFGLTPDAASGSLPDGGIYTPEATHRTYGRLAELAEAILQAGLPVVVDATFLKRHERDRFSRVAAQHEVPYFVVATLAPESILRERVAQRGIEGSDASEADTRILERQLAGGELPVGDEPVVSLETGQGVDGGELERAVRERGFG